MEQKTVSHSSTQGDRPSRYCTISLESDKPRSRSKSRDRKVEIKRVTAEECRAAIQGLAVPGSLELMKSAARSFVVSAVIMTDLSAEYPQIARARNARLIVNNVMPDGLDDPDHQLYCISRPDFAREDAYRELVLQFSPCVIKSVGHVLQPAMLICSKIPGILNGDTAVRWKLSTRFAPLHYLDTTYMPPYDIEEVSWLGEKTVKLTKEWQKMSPDET
ncbi:hypothetical protein BBP40_010427, partial [Aspergillus hancockii]